MTVTIPVGENVRGKMIQCTIEPYFVDVSYKATQEKIYSVDNSWQKLIFRESFINGSSATKVCGHLRVKVQLAPFVSIFRKTKGTAGGLM